MVIRDANQQVRYRPSSQRLRQFNLIFSGSILLGDLGQTFNSLSTLQHYLKNGGESVLFVGDLSYADRYQHNDGIRWDSWGRFVERSTAYQPWIWNSGNHEIEYRPDLVCYDVISSCWQNFASESSKCIYKTKLLDKAVGHVSCIYIFFLCNIPLLNWEQETLSIS